MGWFEVSAWLDGLGGLNPVIIYVAIGGLALLESAAFVGLFVPGESAVLLGGVLAHEGNVNVVVMILVVALGATLGDSISFELGRRVPRRWLVDSKVAQLIGPQRLEAGRNYLARRGSSAIFFGRFVAVVRTGVPVLAGASPMRYRAFLTWNVLGAVLWAVLHVSLGYAAGASSEQLGRVIHSAGLVAVGAIVVIVVAAMRRPRALASGEPACELVGASHAD